MAADMYGCDCMVLVASEMYGCECKLLAVAGMSGCITIALSMYGLSGCRLQRPAVVAPIDLQFTSPHSAFMR